jgi:hypothetical protein
VPSSIMACRLRSVAATKRTSTLTGDVAPTLFQLALLNQTENLDLKFTRHLADFVKKQSATTAISTFPVLWPTAPVNEPLT